MPSVCIDFLREGLFVCVVGRKFQNKVPLEDLGETGFLRSCDSALSWSKHATIEEIEKILGAKSY